MTFKFNDLATAKQDTQKEIAAYCEAQRNAVLRQGRDEFSYKTVNCTMAQLRYHIERQLPDGITFDDNGLWDLAWTKDPYAFMDHDIGAFDKHRISKDVNNWQNLRPLVKDGVSKKTSASSMFDSAVQKTRAMDRANADRAAFARALRKSG